ncbi:MAG: 3-phosphoserine/phosphohydroxythreonine transaminase [Phycisphaerales bacterium]
MTTTHAAGVRSSSHGVDIDHLSPGRAFNFSAGPGVLPEEVIREAQDDLMNLMGTGIGIAEQSHRGKAADAVWAETHAACRRVGNVPDNYKILFLTGGATSQNFMIPANLLPEGGSAEYLTTGYWAEKTFEEGKFYSKNVHEAWDGRKVSHAFCPADNEIAYAGGGGGGGGKPAYVHMCSNNTIYGTQWRNADGTFRYPKMPDGVPLICDASSDIYSRPMDISKFGMVYAGAQKNIGIAGTTLVIIREDLLEAVRPLPTMLKYATHAKDESRHNTPPVFPIYVAGLVFKWIEKTCGKDGLSKMHARNMAKAKVIYDVLDSTEFFVGHARKDSRSLMNISFKVNPKVKDATALDEKFVKEAKAAGMDQLKGHRSTGGVRASVYNAFPMSGVETLASFMRDFERKNG